MKFYLNGKNVSRKSLAEKYGKEKIAQRVEDAKETWLEDPYTEVSWMDGMLIENELQETMRKLMDGRKAK